MKKYEKEVQQAFIDNEKDIMKKLKESYEDALGEINDKIAQLMGRNDATLQNVIYRIEYQRALQTQVKSILEKLQANEFETVAEFLEYSYEEGFLGAMYSMQQQGVPLIIPIDQELVVAAIQHETQLTSSLYTEMGKDIGRLQKQIAGEISRGISSGMTYGEIARNIATYSRIPLNRAMTISRTESHRISETANSHAQKEAKAKGAKLKKIWDSTLDRKTRDSHMKVDGEIRELEEKFSNGLMFPGESGGRPEEVINCRCRSRTEAEWALGIEETKALGNVKKMSDKRKKEIADKLGIPVDELELYSGQIVTLKPKNYNDFKEQYKQASERVRRNVQKIILEEALENDGKSSTIVAKKDVSKYIGKTIVDKDNQSIREWYHANVHDIPNQIDKNKPFEEQVKQAYSLRNKYKHEARVAMSDRETAERLEKKRPAKSFDELLKDKMQRKNMTEEEALKDILETASKTNENIDKEFGL